MEGQLSPSEYEKISSVLKRDRELRLLEESRVRQLKQELLCLRKRAALRPGVDPLRNCARCSTELGRILNRGALCPSCLKKVCKDCRVYGDENHEWLCVYCFKQMQLKAISGDWMQEFSKQSVRHSAKDPPRDQLRKVLHEFQRKGLLDAEVPEQKNPIEIPPQKPPRLFQYEQPQDDVVPEYKTDVSSAEIKQITVEVYPQPTECNSNQSPKIIPRISPWNGIDPDPTIPLRVDKSRSFGSVHQYDYSEQCNYRERQSSDEGNSTLGFRSRSTSSEVVDESDSLTPVPLPRKRLSPLKKQQAIPEPSAVEKQHSSVDTVDSGVFSPGLKMESSIDTTAPPSPLTTSRLSSVEHENADRTAPFEQRPTFDSSSSENEDECQPPLPAKSSDTLFRKVTLKKRGSGSSGTEPIKEKTQTIVTSADMNPATPHSGLNCSFLHSLSNSFSRTYPKYNFIHSNTNISNSDLIKCSALGCGLKQKLNNKNVGTLANSKVHMEACAGNALSSNLEALCDGTQLNVQGDVHLEEEECVSLERALKIHSSYKELQKKDWHSYRTKKTFKNEHIELDCQISTDELSEKEYCNIHNTCSNKKHFKFKSAEIQNRSNSSNLLFRSLSLPNRRTFTYNWLQTWLWKCHSLEDWLWYLEEQPCESRDFSQINILPNDYKLVYVSSSSDSEDSSLDCSDFPKHYFVQNDVIYSDTNAILNSSLKMNYDTSCTADSDWELESVDSDDSDLFLSLNKNENLIQVNEANNFFIHHNLKDDKERDHKQKLTSSFKVENLKYRSSDSIVAEHDQAKKINKCHQISPFSFCKMKTHSSSNNSLLCNEPNLQNLHYLREWFNPFSFDEMEHTNQNFNLPANFVVSDGEIQCCLLTSQNNETNSCVSPLKSENNSLDLKKQTTPSLLMIHSSLIHVQYVMFLKLVSNILCDNLFCSNSNIFDSPNSSSVCISLSSCIQLSRDSTEIKKCQHYPFNDKNETVLDRMSIDDERHSSNENLFFHGSLNCFTSLKAEPLQNCLKLKFSEKKFHIMCDASISKKECVSIETAISVMCSKNRNNHEMQFRYENFIPIPSVILFLHSNNLFSRSKEKRCGGKIYSLQFGDFCNPSWRHDCYGKVGKLLHPGDANAFHCIAFPPSSVDPTHRGNDKSATGWGKQRCSIASRVIDLNLRALECGREVLDVADLTPLLGWVAVAAKHGGINAFFYHAPPVAWKPEADYLLRLTRSDPCLLFQRSPHTSGVACVIAVEAVSVVDYVSKFRLDERTKGANAMQLEDEKSLVQNIPQCSELISYVPAASRLGDATETSAQTAADGAEKSPTGTRERVSKLYPILNLVESDINGTVNICTQSVDSSTKISFNQDIPESLKCFDADILSCVRNIFFEEFSAESEYFCKNELFVNFPSTIYDCSDAFERVDCHCNKPCDVPSSPSVVDATRSLGDDGEILSSGDELDKLESDTDSQDTVIEGEAYKRIRSVAIKEKILHANEELFGVNVKESFCDNSGSNKFSDISSAEVSSENPYNVKEIVRKTHQNLFHHEPNTKSSSYSSLEEVNNLQSAFSVPKHFQPFKQANLSAFHPVSSLSFIENKINEVESSDCSGSSNEASTSSSYKVSFCENICSSESSDNGSDGEEVILSDTSTSSDEATYIAPSAAFRYYNYSHSYRLHTIAEESCEESEKSSRSSGPTSRANSDFEYFDKIQLSVSKNPRKMLRKSIADNTILGHSKSGKSSVSYAVLATSRLEKYFKSGLLEGEVSYPEDDMTDESGGISSDDEISSAQMKDKLKDQFNNGKTNLEKPSKRTNFAASEKSSMYSKSLTNSVSNAHKLCSSNLEAHKLSLERNNFRSNSSYNTTCKTEPLSSDVKQNKGIESVSDDDAKYIMNHLMQRISNDTDLKPEIYPEVKDVSPMLKILESEIARLMLTVSPASLSTGDPSSSCSSTIGSNNSDYGSDTLESAEDSTSDEDINTRDVPGNRAVLDPSTQNESTAATDNIDNPSVESNNDEVPQVSETVVSEETLYICKQLMASLKKIADATEGTSGSDECCSNSEDNSAKQYITDQIVSLMQTVNASHSNSPLLRTLTSNVSSIIQVDSDVSQDRSDSDSPPLNDEKRDHLKSKTPSESGSETTISASISIPSYDDSDRTPTESEISHEMDELYALLENNGTHQDVISSAKFSYDFDANTLEKSESPRNIDSPFNETFSISNPDSCDIISTSDFRSSLLSGAASKLESLLPISIEERIARYKDAFLGDENDSEYKMNETRINVILPRPSKSDLKNIEEFSCKSRKLACFNPDLKVRENCDTVPCSSDVSKSEKDEANYNITSVKIISHNTYPLSSAIHKILSSNIDSKYLEQKLDYQIVSILESSSDKISLSDSDLKGEDSIHRNEKDVEEDSESNIITPLPKVINPKEKASSENDLLVANYRTESKVKTVIGTKSVGNISELENTSNKSGFRDTGYYSFKSSEDSFLSFDDSTSQTSSASLTKHRSLTSTETIPEEEETCTTHKGTTTAKISLSSSNIPDAVCDASSSKSSTLPLSLRSKLSVTPGGNHRSRSSFFSTSGVLRKLTLLRDESGNSLRSSPHGRLRMRNRSLSGGSEDGKQRKTSVPQISVSECLENTIGRSSVASSEKESSGVQEDEIDQAFAYHCRSQMSLSSFGGRSESVTSVYSAAGGGRYGTVTVTGEVLFGLSYNYKTSILEINIKECRNLAAVDVKRNRSDPYVKIYLLPDRTKSGKRKTKVKKHTLNPVFEESLKFHVTVNELIIRTLWLSVWHSDRFGRNDFLGEVMLPLGNDAIENSGSKWYPLQERLETLDTPVSYKGDLILALKYVPPDVTSRKFSKKPGIPVKGALEVLVREARNLMATRSNGTSDPFCKSYLLPDKSKSGKQKTPVLKKSCNPKWNHTFIYDDVSLEDLKERCLELTIWDYDKITSNDFLGGVRLCLGTGKYQGREVDWMDSVGEERSLWYTMLERPNTWVDGSLLLRPNMQGRRVS